MRPLHEARYALIVARAAAAEVLRAAASALDPSTGRSPTAVERWQEANR